MSRPTTRILALLELLQTHDRLSGAEIARRLEVDRRTVRRYITVLEDMGIPVTTEQGRHGGYMLVAGFRLPPLMFTDEEALVIALGLLSVRETGLAETGAAVESVQAKLERVMPALLKSRLRGISDNIRLITPRRQNAAQRSLLLKLIEAAQNSQRVRMIYCSPRDERMQRELDPYGLVFRERYWYVSGYCHLRAALRSFRLDRLSDLEILPHHFEKPSGFNAAAHLLDSMRHASRQHEVRVLLKTDIGRATQVMGDMTGLFQQQEEGLLLTMATDSHYWFAGWLMQLPFPFTIIGPPALKAAMGEHVARLQAACQS